jgi:phosphonate transport system substrate-binding protein
MSRRLRPVLFLAGLFLPALSQPAVTAAAEKPTVFFGVIPRYNPMVMYRSYQPLMDYLTESTPYRFELKLSRDYTEAVEFLRNGTTQIASLGDVTFAEARQGFGARPIVKPLNARGEPFYRSIIIVRDDSPLRSLQELKGRSFAFGNLHSTSGNLIPRELLHRHGVTLFMLGSYSNLDSHDAVAKAVLKGKVEAGAVKDVVAYRYREHGLRFLAMSDPIPSVPIVVPKNASPELVEAVTRALLAIDPSDPRQRERMKEWDPEFRNGFAPASEADYLPIYRMIEAIPGGCGQQCH